MPDHVSDKRKAIQWAYTVLNRPETVILDSETTGLGSGSEIVQLAIIDSHRTVLFNSLIRPDNPERLLERGKGGKCAADIHGIRPEMLREAPHFRDIYVHLRLILDGKLLIIYNAEYDWDQIMVPTCKRLHLETPRVARVTCAMKVYAAYFGAWSSRHGSYTFQPLQGGDHSALGDCLATITRIEEMSREAFSDRSEGVLS